MDESKNESDKLFALMGKDSFRGTFKKVGNYIIWNITDNIEFKIQVNNILNESYVEALYTFNGNEEYLMHWHPMTDEIYNCLIELNKNGGVIIIKKTLFGKSKRLLSKEEFSKNKLKYKNRFFINYSIVEF